MPPLLVGRDAQLEDMRVAVERLAIGRFERSQLLTGLRGVGKTVLLVEFARIANERGWRHAHVEATEDVRLPTALATIARRVLLEFSVGARSADRARRGLAVLRSFIKVHVPLGDGTSLTIDAEAHPGPADTGMLDVDLGAVLCELGETARAADSGVLITLDELQYLKVDDLSALIVGLHQVSQRGLPVLLTGAGLPSLPGLVGEARSYAERLFRFVTVGSLVEADARRALAEPVELEGASWSEAALAVALASSQGYPYFLQEFGKQAWDIADGPTITAADMSAAIMLAVDDLDRGFFRARIDRTTNTERDYMRAMASLGGPGPYGSGAVSAKMGRRTNQTGPIRDGLIKRGLCWAPRHGEIAFTVPMFDEFVRRAL
jgi:hypothetical protein